MTQASNRYCFNCHKTIADDNTDNFCSSNCQDKYMMDRDKWDRLKKEKEDDRARTT